MNPIFYNINIIRFKIRIITTQPMNKHPRIFPKAPHSSPLTPSATQSTQVFDPFNNNYTLTGLVSNIDRSLGELITAKKTSECELEQDRKSQLNALVKIRQQVHVLKNIITYNLDQILSHMYQPSHKPQEDTRTNHSSSHGTARGDQPLDPSLAILDFQHEPKSYTRPHRSQQMPLKLPDSPENPHLSTFGSQPEQKDLVCEGITQKQRFNQSVTPFQLEEPQFDIMRIQDNQQEEEQEEIFDLICYQKEISTSKTARFRQNMKEHTFSPIFQRAPEEEQTIEKKRMSIEKHQDQITPRFQQTLSKKLFNYTAPVLPKRVSHKKYNYLEQLNEHHY